MFTIARKYPEREVVCEEYGINTDGIEMPKSDNEDIDKGHDLESNVDGNRSSEEEGFRLEDFEVPNRDNVDNEEL